MEPADGGETAGRVASDFSARLGAPAAQHRVGLAPRWRPNLAAGLTYYALLSLFPALIVVVALLALVGRASAASVALDLVRELGPPGAADTLRGSVERVIQERAAASGLLSLGLLAAVWSASNYVGAFMWSANQIYEVQGRPFLRRMPRGSCCSPSVSSCCSRSS